jgi:hypothetical protein
MGAVKYGLVTLFAATGVIVWALAAVGAMTIARAVSAEQPTAPQDSHSLLDLAAGDVPGVDLPGLQRYPGSIRAEYRQAVWDDLVVTEVEYRTTADVEPVRLQVRDAFGRSGWTIEHSGYFRGEWTYLVSHGDRKAAVEIERFEGVTEVEIELAEPAESRAFRSGR